MLYRHGDVLIERVPALPRQAQVRPGLVLARGEVTGHAHRIRESHAARLWDAGGQTFVQVLEPAATLVHEEHRSISLPEGIYRFWLQREYAPDADRWVED